MNLHSLKDLIFSYPRLRHYSVFLEDGKLKISLSEAWFYRAILGLSLVALVSLGAFTYLFIYFPTVEKRWLALVIAGAIGILMTGVMLVTIVVGIYRVYTFDRDTDRVLLRSRRIRRLSEVAQVEVTNENRRGSHDESYVLTIVFHGGERERLVNRLPPPDELIELAKMIGDFVGVRVVKSA